MMGGSEEDWEGKVSPMDARVTTTRYGLNGSKGSRLPLSLPLDGSAIMVLLASS